MTTTAAPTVNYYAILGLPPTASGDAIEQKIKEEQRTWRKRSGSADLGKRQEAETRMERLAEAKTILLDPRKRAEYDRALPTMPTDAAVPKPTAGGTTDWVALAQQYLAANDYHSASYAAREATHVLGNSAEAWNLRARANGGLGRFEDALYEARQAVGLDQLNASYLFDLGLVQESLSRWADALQSYETAASIEPGNFVYRLSVAGVFLQNGMPDKALPILEQVYSEHAGNEMVDYYLASCLHDLAERTPRVHNDSRYVVTSEEEIDRMEALVRRAKSLKHGDPELDRGLVSTLTYLEACRQTKFFLPPVLADAGFGLLAFLFVGPFFIVLCGLGALTSNAVGGGLVLLAISGLWLWALARACWVPVWKANARIHRGS